MTRWDVFPMARGPCAPASDVQGGWQVTSWFGTRTDPITGRPGTGHGGQDLAHNGCHGAELFAVADATLAQGWDPSGGGNWSGLTLDQDGSYCGLGHALSFAPGASYRHVLAGELIAYCDSTGGSTGSHVHVCYRAPGSYSYSDPFWLLDDSQHRIAGEDPGEGEEGGPIHSLTGAAMFIAFGPHGAALVGTGYWGPLDQEGFDHWSTVPGMVVHSVDARGWDVLHAGATHGQSADDPST